MTPVTSIDRPFIEKNTSRHGTVRYYLRMDGIRICRLPNQIGSEEFDATYWRERHKYEASKAPVVPAVEKPLASRSTRPGSFKSLCLAYMASSEFRLLDLTTQAKRRSIIESMWIEKVKITGDDDRTFADIPLVKMTANNIEKLRDRKKEKPFAADERLKVLRQVFATKDGDGKPITENVALLVSPFRATTEGHATARPEELASFIAHHGIASKAVLGLALLMFTGIRVSDLARIGPQHRRKDEFQLRLFKNRNRAPVTLVIPIHPILDAVLRQHPTNAFTYMVTEYGKSFSIKGLGNRVSGWFSQANLGHLTAHSVRKGLATDQAHNDATDSMLEALFGWRDGKTSKIYTRNAEQARLARKAVAQIRWDGLTDQMIAELPKEVEENASGSNPATPFEPMAFRAATPRKK